MGEVDGSEVSAGLELVKERLCVDFPAVAKQTIDSIVHDSYNVVIEAHGDSVMVNTEKLARMRLEVVAAYLR